MPRRGVARMWRDPWRDLPPHGREIPEPRISETELRVIGWGLGTTTAAGVLVWLAGQLAGLLFGHTWLHLSVWASPDSSEGRLSGSSR
jgi:hypothetical protein